MNPEINFFKTSLQYDNLKGVLTWSKNYFKTKIGKEAGTLHPNGYLYIGFRTNGKFKSYAAHRIIWFLFYNKWPEKQLDHINGNKLDNRIENLREASHRENQQNQKRHRAGKLVGASFNKNDKKWCAYIRINNKGKYLGSFSTEREAHEAYKTALVSLETLL
jgi:HNH endonuclease